MSSVRVGRSAAHGEIELPPSKSFAIRALFCAVLAEGTSHVSDIGRCDDVLNAVSCLRHFADVVVLDVSPSHPAVATVHGTAAGLKGNVVPDPVLDCGESAAVFRFALATGLLLRHGVSLTGSPRLLERCASSAAGFCLCNGFDFNVDDRLLAIAGRLRGGQYRVGGGKSSQMVSALLVTLPLVEEDSVVVIEGGLVSKPYIRLTLDVMRLFGVNVLWDGGDRIPITGRQCYRPCDCVVEADWSAGAYAALFGLNGGLGLKNLNVASSQGDRACLDLFDKLKRGFQCIDISDIPDLAPALMAVAAACHGAELTGTGRLSDKECDRGAAMAAELAKMGVSVKKYDDSLLVGCGLHRPAGHLDSHNDHRVAFALCFLLSVVSGVLDDIECVAKSWPSFFDDMKSVGVDIFPELD